MGCARPQQLSQLSLDNNLNNVNIMMPNDQPVLGVPLRHATSTPPTLIPTLVKCKSPGCGIELPSDLVYCGIHKCAEFGCKNIRIHSSIFCGGHYAVYFEQEVEDRLIKNSFIFF